MCSIRGSRIEQSLRIVKLKLYTTFVRYLNANVQDFCHLGSSFFTTTKGTKAHTAGITFAFLADFGWLVFKHPSYNSNMTLSDYCLFPLLKKWLGTQRFTNDADSKTKVSTCSHKQEPSFYTRGIEILMSRYEIA